VEAKDRSKLVDQQVTIADKSGAKIVGSKNALEGAQGAADRGR